MGNVLLLVVKPPLRARWWWPVAGSLATALLVALGIGLGTPATPLLLALLLHFLVAPAVLAPRAARTLVPVQLLLVPATLFVVATLAVALLPVLHTEAPVGLLAVSFYALEPGLVALWVGPNPAPAMS